MQRTLHRDLWITEASALLHRGICGEPQTTPLSTDKDRGDKKFACAGEVVAEEHACLVVGRIVALAETAVFVIQIATVVRTGCC